MNDSRTAFLLSDQLDEDAEEIEIDERELERDPPGVHLRYNHTEPSVISDGVDFIAVIA